MKINNTKEIQSFFDTCYKNLYSTELNDFLGVKVTKGQEKYIQNKLAKYGAQEFQVPAQYRPSLFLSTDEWMNSPYHRTIHLDHIQNDHFSYVKEPVYGNELFNAYAIQQDQNKMLGDWMKLRAMDKDFETIYLLQDEQDWMMDAPSEAYTNDIPAGKAHGNVLTFGLGIGYFIFMAMQNSNVKSVTVIERSKEVIDMFQKFLLPQFPDTVPLHFIHGDAFDYFNEEFLSGYDYTYVDIWQSNDDGLYCIEKLLEQYLPVYENCDFWIEDSCLVPIRTLLFLSFDEVRCNKKIEVDPVYKRTMNKFRKYVKSLDIDVCSPEPLKNMMYDNALLRTILSSK